MFCFDIENDITQVELDLNEPHYYLEVGKRIESNQYKNSNM